MLIVIYAQIGCTATSVVITTNLHNIDSISDYPDCVIYRNMRTDQYLLEDHRCSWCFH